MRAVKLDQHPGGAPPGPRTTTIARRKRLQELAQRFSATKDGFPMRALERIAAVNLDAPLRAIREEIQLLPHADRRFWIENGRIWWTDDGVSA